MIEPGSPTFLVRFSTSNATSSRACLKPIGCTHCLPVALVKSAQSSAADCPVNPDLNGWSGDHHSSDDRPTPRSPSASMEAGKSNALATVTAFGLKPCCAHCAQNVAKSGGRNT